MKENEVKVTVSAEINTILSDLYGQVEYELRDDYEDGLEKAQQEIDRLNNIIDEFDKWLIGEKMMFYKGSDGERLIRYGETKKIWLELKGE